MNSRAKGCRGEREWRDELRAAGFIARRGQQFCGLGGADVVCDDLPEIWWEVKRTQRGNPYDWLTQASIDALQNDRIPVIAHKRNHSHWIVVLRAHDFLDILRRSDLPVASDNSIQAAGPKVGTPQSKPDGRLATHDSPGSVCSTKKIT